MLVSVYMQPEKHHLDNKERMKQCIQCGKSGSNFPTQHLFQKAMGYSIVIKKVQLPFCALFSTPSHTISCNVSH